MNLFSWLNLFCTALTRGEVIILFSFRFLQNFPDIIFDTWTHFQESCSYIYAIILWGRWVNSPNALTYTYFEALSSIPVSPIQNWVLNSVNQQIEKVHTAILNKEMGAIKRNQTINTNKQARIVEKNKKIAAIVVDSLVKYLNVYIGSSFSMKITKVLRKHDKH